MIYEWQCNDCGKAVNVIASVSHYKTPPSLPCVCGANSWSKIIGIPAIKRTDLRDAVYPFTFKKAGGQPVLFTSHKQQSQWMDANGYMLFEDAVTPDTLSDSQRSSFDQLDVAPTDDAIKHHKEGFWVENPDQYI